MKRLLMSLMLALCFVASASAQRYDGTAISYKGTPVPFAAVAVCTQPAVTLTTPCTPQATLYTDLTLSVISVNPLTADAYGNYHFYVNPVDGPFTVQVYGGTITTPIVLTDQMPTGSLNGSASGITNTLPKWTGAKTLGNSCASDDGTTFSISCAQVSANTLSLTNPLALLSGGNGTSTPALTAGLNMDLTGTWPNYTIGTLADVTFNSVTAQTVDATTINASNINSSSSGANGLISGGGIFWLHDLVYAVAKTTVSIGGQSYTAPQTDVTLSAADPSNPRFDTFYADINSTINAITGTAGSNPVTPQVDPTTQWGLGYVEVAAGETAPSITNLTLYDENTGPPSEWTCSTSGSGWNCADTSHPDSGTKDISADGSSATSYVKLTADALTDLSSYDVMKVRLYTVSAWSGKNEVWLAFYSGTNPVGSAVFTSINNYGFDGTVTGSYQYVIIPMTAFNLGNNTVDSVRILWNTGGKTATGKTIYLDNIQLQGNGVTGGSGGSGNVTSVGVQGDGTVINTALLGSPVTGNGTMQMSLVPFPAGYGLFGPIASLGSNVGVRQSQICSWSGSTSHNCSLSSFASPPLAGDKWLIWTPQQAAAASLAMTDDLGSTITVTLVSGSGAKQYIGLGTIAATGTTQIHISNTYGNGFGSCASGTTPCNIAVILELVGTSAYVSGSTVSAASSISPQTLSVTPGSSTDAIIRFSMMSNNASTPGGTVSISPIGSTIQNYSAGDDVVDGYGRFDILAPGSTALVSNVFTWTQTTGDTTHASQFEAAIVLSQDALAGAAPPTARKATEGDLPASAISAIQSVNDYTLSGDVAISGANTANTVLSETITMPPQGCPCRIAVSYNLYTSAPTTSSLSIEINSWVSDGTNSWAAAQTTHLQDTAVDIPNDQRSLTATQYSPVSYTDNESVTITLKVAADNGTDVVISKTPVNTASPVNSGMQLSVLQSKN